MGRRALLSLILIMMVLALLARGLDAFTFGQQGSQDNLPIHITSDQMIANQKEGKISFLGNVITRRGDLIINSDKLEIYNRGEGNRVIIASGHVKMNQGNRAAEAEIIEFYEAEQKIVLKGNPVIQEEGRIIKGSEMTFYIQENRSLVKGEGGRRVNVTLYPPKTTKKER